MIANTARKIETIPAGKLQRSCGAALPPVSSLRSRKNFWLKMNATPLISSTLASAVVFLLMKLAVMAIASFPLNSFLLKPGRGGGGSTNVRKETVNQWESSLNIEDGTMLRSEQSFVGT